MRSRPGVSTGGGLAELPSAEGESMPFACTLLIPEKYGEKPLPLPYIKVY